MTTGDILSGNRAPDCLARGEQYQGDGVILMEHCRSSLKYERAGDVEPVLEGRWLIHGLLPSQGVATIYGHSGTGKTFVAQDLAAHIVSGAAWNGEHVESGLVVYVVAEGQAGFRNRLVAMRQAGKFAALDPFVFIPTPIDMLDPDGDCVRLVETIKVAASAEGATPVMVVIDTLSKTFGGGKENSDDMAIYLANCQRVASAFDCLTLIIHHRPKDSESRDLRGHSSLRAGVDAAILVEGDEARRMTVIKQKDGEEGGTWGFELEPVTLGTDSRGDEVTSCVVRWEERRAGFRSEMDSVARDTADNKIFLACLAERTRQQRAVSDKRSPTFAPAVFDEMPESKRIGRKRLEQAMERLFRTAEIERAELWKGADRKPVFGLRLTAGNGAAITLRETQATALQAAEMRAGNAGDTHTYSYGIEAVAPWEATASDDWGEYDDL